jgi:nucleoside phosphorylase
MDQEKRPVRLAICAAMRWEIRPVLRALRGVQLLRSARPRTWLASHSEGPILVFQTGVGVDAATTATRTILSEYTPEALINTGCAGSLAPDLRVGDVVCASTLLAEGPTETLAYPTNPELTSGLTRAASAAGLSAVTGTFLTSVLPLLTPEAKAAAFARHAAAVVEMEGAAVAQLLAGTPMRLASVRVILDDVTTTLPTPGEPSKTMFDFARNVTKRILSVEEVKRFSLAAKNAAVVDRVLGNLFKFFFRSDV